MYEYLSGMLTKVTPKYVVLDNSGVGYLIYVPNPYNYKVNDYCTIWVYQAVREDSIDLYGFSTFEEKELFLKLILLQELALRHHYLLWPQVVLMKLKKL